VNVLLAETILLWQTAAVVLALGVLLLLIFFGLKLRDADRLAAELRTERDTTARQQRELEDQAKAERQTLFNSMGEGVVLLDRGGRIQLVNQSLEKQFGLSVDVRGQTLNEAFRRPELSQLLERLETERNLLSGELDMGGNEARYFEVTAARVFDREGRAQGTIFVFHDLTRIRQLENTRREFVANVSHELRTPLSLIKGYVETLLDGAISDPELSAKFLQTIERHSNRLTNLIEDLLTISRLESGQITLQLRAIPLRPFAASLTTELQTRAKERGTTITNEIPEGLAGRADPDRLEQVFVNLIENAIKYGRNKGNVRIKGRAVNGHVELCVADDGPGIPAESRERVFERFYRIDKARSRDAGGTGLGLAIVKHIIQSHGGKVWVDSEAGRGSQFYFTLPV
jgi:two-component system, OmpR family, phosphate regulon sensor histidine kinase PhoR